MSFIGKEYSFYSEIMKALQREAKEANVRSIKHVLKVFYVYLKDLAKINYCNRDILPDVEDTYTDIIEKLSYNDLKKSFNYVHDNYGMILSDKIIDIIITKYPDLKGWIFDRIIENIKKHPETLGHNLDFISVIMMKFSPEQADRYLDKVLDLQSDTEIYIIRSFLKDLYEKVPSVRSKIFNFVVDYTRDKNENNLSLLYDNLCEFVKLDEAYFNFCVTSIEKDLSNPMINKKIIVYMVNILARTYQKSAYRDISKRLLDIIKSKEDLLDINIKRGIARITEDKEDLRSSVSYGKRVEKTYDHPFGYEDVEEIPTDKPCIMIFGGSGVDRPQYANGGMSDIEYLLRKYDLDNDVDIYSIVYNFGDIQDEGYAFDDNKARKKLIFEHGRRRLKAFMDSKSERYAKTFEITSTEDTNPRYIQQIFDTVFLPRISQDGHRINAEKAKRNIRKITIYAHCHGAYTFLKIEELMQQKMDELGYTKQEKQEIQKQLLCVAYAPYCPLGVSKSTMISFLSAIDTRARYYNLMELIGRNMIKDLSWFPDKQGNVFVSPQITKIIGSEIDEHGVGFSNSQDEEISDAAKLMLRFREQALINGIKSSVMDKDLPSVQDLVTGGDAALKQEFIKATINGATVQDDIVKKIKTAKEQGRKL